MKLYKLIAGIYTGKIKTYNTRRSNKTGLTYLNLTVTINANGQKVDFQKSYCLDPGKNMDIIEIMEAVDELQSSSNSDTGRKRFWKIRMFEKTGNDNRSKRFWNMCLYK